MSSHRALTKTASAVIVVVILVAAIAAGALLLTGPATKTPTTTTQPTTKKVRVAVMLPGSITDFGFNAGMYQAALKLNSTDPNVEVTVAEGLGQAGPAVLSTMRDFAKRGYDIIVAWTIGYQDAVLTVAPDFPKTYFMGIAFYQFNNLTNAGAVADQFYESYYLEGLIAGAMTKTNTVGWIDGQEFPLANAQANAFFEGAKRTNANAKLKWVYAGVWDDLNKGREQAKALIDAGVDVLSTRGDGITLGAIQAASLANILVFGDIVDQSSLAPKNMIASSIYNSDFVLTESVRLFRAGKLFGNNHYPITLTIANGGVDIAFNKQMEDKIPARAMQEVAKVKADVKAGTFTVPRILGAPKG